jgi:hypothetical protein
MNMKTTHRAVRPYEAPEAEEIRVDMECGFLILSDGETGNSTTTDLEEIDYSSSTIWN